MNEWASALISSTSEFQLFECIHLHVFSHLLVKPACGERDIVVTTSVWCVCRACIGACIHQDLYGPLLEHLCMDFTVIWHSCCPSGVERQCETFVHVG